MLLLLVSVLLSEDLLFHHLDFLLLHVLLIVELVLQSQKVLVQRDTVSQKSFIPRGLVLLVNFAVLQKLDLVLKASDLSLQGEDQLILKALVCLTGGFAGYFLLLLVVSPL